MSPLLMHNVGTRAVVFELSGRHQLVGCAVRQDGKTASLTAPGGKAQQALYACALADANVLAASVAIIEAHGTGTALGDPIETGSLRAIMNERRASSAPLSISSVKANMGHAEPSAGGVGLLKLRLVLDCERALPNTQLQQLNGHFSQLRW